MTCKEISCEMCGKKISEDEAEQFYGFCEECFSEMEIIALDEEYSENS